MSFKRIFFFIFFTCFTLLLHHANLHAQNQLGKNGTDTILVGITGSEPFLIYNNGNYKGIAPEIWDDIAYKKAWNYKYIPFKTVEGAIQALTNLQLDLIVGPISITSNRLEEMRFSQPFYNSSLAIVSRTDELSLWQKIKPIFSLKLFMAVGLFLIILGIVGTLFWIAEHKKSPDQFPKNPVDGIANGMWLAIVTMSTTGYGDKAPITLWGRIIAGTWMVISIIFATSMVAGIASTLTISSLGSSTVTNIEQLSNQKVATISDSPSIEFLQEHQAKVIETNKLNEAIDLLKEKSVKAVVYDRPQLLHYLNKKHDDELYIAKAEYYKQGYGFAFPLNSNLVYEVNRALLEHAEELETERIINFYLQKD